MKYSGFSRRACAYILDWIIFQIPFSFVFGVQNNESSVLGIHIVLWSAYIVWMTGTYGATIGKMIMKIKVVSEKGKKINYSDALVREIASYLSMMVLFLGYLNVVWDPKKQSWHDKIAKTVVISSK